RRRRRALGEGRKIPAPQDIADERGVTDDRRRPLAGVEERELAEDRARREAHQPDVAAVCRTQVRARGALRDDEELVGRIALAEDHLSLLVLDALELLLDGGQVLYTEARADAALGERPLRLRGGNHAFRAQQLVLGP